MAKESNGTKMKKFAAAVEAKIGPVHVRLDSQAEGVIVPPNLKGPSVLLNFSPRFDPPDLQADVAGISQTLSFDGKACHVFIPWDAVWAIEMDRDDLCGFFADSIPPAVVEVVFADLLAKQATLKVMSGVVAEAVRIYDSGGSSGDWRRWRANVKLGEAPPKPKGGLVLLNGGKPEAEEQG